MPPTTRTVKRAKQAKADATPSRVFDVVELLELVLLNESVSQIDLFVLQRVCKTFHTTIQHSPTLQRKLLVLPKDKPGTGNSTVLETLLKNIIPGLVCYAFLQNPQIFSVGYQVTMNGDRDIGWRGKRTVHPRGSWEKMKIRVPENFHNVIVTVRMLNPREARPNQVSTHSIRVEGERTLGKIADILRGCFAEWAVKEDKLLLSQIRLLQEKIRLLEEKRALASKRERERLRKSQGSEAQKQINGDVEASHDFSRRRSRRRTAIEGPSRHSIASSMQSEFHHFQQESNCQRERYQ